jgi:hypothetical protein
MTVFSSYLAKKAVTSDAMNIHLSDDGLRSVMSIETLLAHDLVPEGLPTCSTEPADSPY